MNNKLIIKFNTKDALYVINKLKEYNITIYNVYYFDDSFLIKINEDDYKIIKKHFFYYDIEIVKRYGFNSVNALLKKYYIYLISFILGLILLFLLTNMIFRVDVIHSNSYIRHIVNKALEDKGIKRFTFKKNYDELSKIKSEILELYPDDLEWIEIENVGLTYQVKVEQRIITKEEFNNKSCNLIANSNALVTRIIPKKGVIVTEENTYVKKGDVLISGEVVFNEEVKNNVCSDGVVYGEVWYTAMVSLPLDYTQMKYTGKKRYNISYKNGKSTKRIFKSRIKNAQTKSRKLFRLFGIDIYLDIDYEVRKIDKKYTSSEAEDLCLKQAIKKISMELGENERILSQKVLKKSINDSKMDMEVFVALERVISKQVNYNADALKNKEINDES